MRRSRIRAYVHIVWATRQRMPWLSADLSEIVYRCIQDEILQLKRKTLAIGGMPDHVHVVVAFPATCSFADMVRRIKGASSHFVKSQIQEEDGAFQWQEGYGLFTLSPNHIQRAVSYVQNQREHHNRGSLWNVWEEVDEEAA